MKKSAVLFVIALTACLTIVLADVLPTDAETSEEKTITDGCFTFTVLQGTANVALTKYTEGQDLAKVEIPATVTDDDGTEYTVTQISYQAFSDCKKAKTIVIPKYVETIDSYAFTAECIERFEVDTLNNHFVADSVGVLFEMPYVNGYGNLLRFPPANPSTTYTVPNSVPQIDSGAFGMCEELTSVTIGKSVLLIGDSAFSSCKKLEEVKFLGDGPGIIGNYAFNFCENLKDFQLPSELQTIGDSAFAGCKLLTAIEIPAKVMSIGEGVFRNCTSLASFSVADGNTKYSVCNYALTVIDSQKYDRTIVAFPVACKLDDGSYLTEYMIPDSIENVLPYAFCGSHITKLTLSSEMLAIDGFAFAYMAELKEVIIPDSVQKIDYSAFMNCSKLETVDVGENVHQIQDMAFWGCTSLKEIILHDGLESIGDVAFANTAITSIVIPQSVTFLGNAVFSDCKYLTLIEIYSKDVYATNAFIIDSDLPSVTVKCYEGALKDIGKFSDNVVFEYYEKAPFPKMNLVGIAACLILLFFILNFLRRI